MYWLFDSMVSEGSWNLNSTDWLDVCWLIDCFFGVCMIYWLLSWTIYVSCKCCCAEKIDWLIDWSID